MGYFKIVKPQELPKYGFKYDDYYKGFVKDEGFGGFIHYKDDNSLVLTIDTETDLSYELVKYYKMIKQMLDNEVIIETNIKRAGVLNVD